MKSIWIYQLLAIASLISSIVCQVKLHDAFTVFGLEREDKRKPGSCYDYYARVSTRHNTKKLNTYWDQIINMNDAATKALQQPGYGSNYVHRKQAAAFFEFEPKDGFGKENMQLPTQDEERELDIHKHAVALWAYQEVGKYIAGHDGQGNKMRKPVLMCDTSGWQLLGPEDAQRHPTTGKPLKGSNGQVLPMKQLPNFAGYWYFWAEDPFPGYIVISRQEVPADRTSPDQPWWPADKTGKRHLCSWTGASGFTLLKRDQRPADVVFLCPQSFKVDADVLDPSKVKASVNLDYLRINAMTLYHEMFHLVSNVFDDIPVHRCKRPGSDRWAACPRQPPFPDSKSSFETYHAHAATAIEHMYLVLYDVAHEETENLKDRLANRNADGYAWFGLASWLYEQTHLDWSTGIARPADAGDASVLGTKSKPRTDVDGTTMEHPLVP